MDNECRPEQIVKASVDVDNVDVLREQRENAVKSFAIKLELANQLWNKFSAWSKLQRVVLCRGTKNVRMCERGSGGNFNQ